MSNSIHYSEERQSRAWLITNVIGIGNVIDRFVWDKGHPNGAEIHCITDTGIIIIYNQRTGKMVTQLIARPQQIKRYYEKEGRKAPPHVVELAFEHQQKGYNHA